MQYTGLTFRKTKNLGRFESETMEVTVALDENDIFEESFVAVKSKVLECLSGNIATLQDKIMTESSIEESLQPKLINYDRKNLAHKEILGDLLKELLPRWQLDYTKECKKVSLDLSGSPMLNEEGKVIDTFKDQLESALISALHSSGNVKGAKLIEDRSKVKENLKKLEGN